MYDYEKKIKRFLATGKNLLICLLISFLSGIHSALPFGGLMEKRDDLVVGGYTKQEETTETLPSSG